MLTERVKKFAGEYDLLRSGELVLAAVSGGCDSVCMLHMLLELSESMGFSVAAAHFDHRLRGEESARDAEFVEKLCRALGVELYMGSGDVAQYARQKGTGTEEAARILRYRFLEDTADKIGAVKIATAHNADDNAETVIFNLIRGAGTRGLCGIPAVRGRIIRPVMCLTRREIEGYLNEKGIAHVDDSTNESDDYTRNKIRHHIVPLLRDINPAAVKNILSSKRSLERDEAYLSELADDFIKNSAKNGTLPVQALLDLPEAVSARVIKKLCPRAESRHIRALLDMCGKSAASL
ncbi:MAG: tRNA lysidine(34) synthetase TilS [Oscillospiraceae bacterium]|nr:tRNA lysidine(34) synthetase TilS [Oscillospiraceae bacterium]